MPPSFLREYLMADPSAVACPPDVAPTAWASALFRYRKRLWTLNPWKLVACKHLLQIHAMRKDKVFVTNLIAVKDVVKQRCAGTHFVLAGLGFF
jgi:hypothetical protein